MARYNQAALPAKEIGARWHVVMNDNTGAGGWLVKATYEVTCDRCGEPFLCWVKSERTGRYYLCTVFQTDIDGLPIGLASCPHKCNPERVQMWTDYLAEQKAKES